MAVKRFYYPESFRLTLNKLEEILDREGSNLSKFIREKASEHVRLHEPGNPQQLLTTVMELGKAYRADACIDCGGPADYEVTETGKKTKFFTCHVHFAQRKPRLKTWRKLEAPACV